MSRLIFHVDVNSSFLSWEAARRVSLGEDDIRLIPSAIGGDRDKRTGVILAKSIPAKKYGIRTGEPVALALRKCPDLYIARPDHRLYEASSKAFMDICREYAPVAEKYSIDECFLDMSGTHRIYTDPVVIAHTIKNKIRDTLGFTVNIGIGDNKILAKMAGDFEKPDKVHTLFTAEIPQKLWPLPIRDLFSVGGATAEKLERSRIRTIGDLANSPLDRIQKIVGVKVGKQIHDYANGIDDAPVLAAPEEAKGYSISTTLEEDVVTKEQAYKVLLALSDSVTARMRADGVKAYCVAVSIRSNDFKTRSHQKKLIDATDISMEVYGLCKQLFCELWDGHTPLRLLGISLTELTKEDSSQMSLFPDEQRERAKKLDKAYDAINKKFGTATIQRGSNLQSDLQVGKKYQAQMEHKTSK